MPQLSDSPRGILHDVFAFHLGVLLYDTPRYFAILHTIAAAERWQGFPRSGGEMEEVADVR